MNKNLTWTKTIPAVTGLLIGAMIALTPAARAETGSFDGQVIDSRLVSNISSTLLEYARRVETLSRDVAADRRVKAEASAYAEYDRLVWFMSALQAGRSANDADEGIELQQMLAVYRAMHDSVAATARAGNRAGSAQQAAMAASVIEAMRTSLRRIEERNYSALYGRTFKVASAN